VNNGKNSAKARSSGDEVGFQLVNTVLAK